MTCPACHGEDLSVALPGYLVDIDGPDAPLVCEECGWTGTEEDS